MVRFEKPRKLLVKLSGEALGGDSGRGYAFDVVSYIATQLLALIKQDLQVAVVVGAGNVFRGDMLSSGSSDFALGKVPADQVGMLGTVMNGLVLQDAIQAQGGQATLFATHSMPSMTEPYVVQHVRESMKSGEICLCVGGTGNPLFTTDSAAALRGIELEVDLVVKATQVDGVYDSDPLAADSNAKKFDRLSLDQAIRNELGVMDLTALVLCRDHRVPIVVYKLMDSEALLQISQGTTYGTLVHP